MKYHFIGDQGISMRGLKAYMASLGHEVTGSDLKTGGHKAENITPQIDVVVRTSAVSPGSAGWVEVEQAQKLGIKVIKRSELLGDITKGKRLVAVSGMHGKTTTTAMVGLALIEAGYDPTILVGDEVKEFEGVLRIGNSDWFVAEACEYDRSFLDLSPEILILTNIEEEHLDTYPGGLKEIKEAFVEYVKNVRSSGCIIACGDDENVRAVIQESKTTVPVRYYGVNTPGGGALEFQLAIPGQHNVQNALAVISLADYLGIPRDIVEKGIKNFTGAHRRFEFKGLCNGAPVIDDYGHHPTEIKVTLDALKERYPDKKRYVVFWPHQYKRIKPLLKEFSESFDLADVLIIKPIYLVPGRDEKLDVSSEELIAAINQKEEKARVMSQDTEIANYLREQLDDHSVVLTIGIPPVYKIADLLVSES